MAFFVANLVNFIFSQNFTNLIALTSNMRIVFLNSTPKTPKEGIFGRKYGEFYCFAKFYRLTDLRVILSNMTIIFSNSKLKIP